MDQELVIVSVYDDLMKNIKDVCQHMKISPAVVEWEQATIELINQLQDLFNRTCYPDVIISRGAVADLIETHFKNIVVIRAEPDDVDLIESICRAKAQGRKIGLLLYEHHAFAYKADLLAEILGLDVLRIYSFRSKDDIEGGIVRAKQDGMDAVVGGGNLGQRTGQKLSYPVYFAETSRRSIQNAILQAVAIINVRRREKKQLQYFRAAIASVQEGIMTLKDGQITLVNNEFTKIFQVQSQQLLNYQFEQLSHMLGDEVCRFIKQESNKDEILKIKNRTCLIKKVDITCSDTSMEIMIVVQDVSEIQQQEQKIRRKLHEKGFEANYRFKDIIGVSDSIKKLIGKATTFAATDANILINGESGTGKELFAQSIHNASLRSRQPFVAVNCAAIPGSLLESELFGYEEGAFSGAKKGGNAGLFELAHGGTIFLDEINSIPITLQGVLLRVIQEKEIRRVGSQNILSVDVRIISATNIDMQTLIADGLFRPDLYYRLNTLSMLLPPLSARKDDILLLADYFLALYCAKYTLSPIPFSKDDRRIIMEKEWRGNVRELENVVHRYVILSCNGMQPVSIFECMDGTVQSEWLQKEQVDMVRTSQFQMPQMEQIDTIQSNQTKINKTESDFLHLNKGSLEEMEQQIILTCLDECKWNRQEAAARLGISRSTLWKKLKNI